MIEARDIWKVYHTRKGSAEILKGVNFTVRDGEKIGILGRNGAGKSTLIRLLSGAEQPTSGTIQRDMTLSWPLAFGGAFQSALTGLDNLRFICRVYGVDACDKIDFVQEFSQLGRYLREPVRTYSSGMRARLSFALSMCIEFDCFLIDEIVAVGDATFHDKCHEELFVKRRDRAMIIVSHDVGYISAHCDKAAVLSNGELYAFDNVNDAYAYYLEHNT